MWNLNPRFKLAWRGRPRPAYFEPPIGQGRAHYPLALILRRCGDDLTRENVMKQATNLKNVVPDLALPGMSISTSPTDYRLNKQLQMMKFDGDRWIGFGPIIDASKSGS